MVPRVIMSKTATSGLTTDTGPSFTESARRTGGLLAALILRNLTGSSPSITGTIQHSADPDSISDANAAWVTLLTFTAQTANGVFIPAAAAAVYFPRIRGVVVRGGTSVTNLDYDVVII